MNKLLFFKIILAAVALETVADVLFRKAAIGNKSILLLIGLVCYFVGSIFWANSLKYEYLSRGIVVFVILNMVLDVLIGYFFMSEHLSTLNMTGVGLGFVSLVLLYL